ncbi:MAG: HAD-IIIC family phosphatase [Pseudomonadota bacterium]
MDKSTLSANLVIAANFTVEPIDAALSFWNNELELWSSQEYAPFDQLFQQLLDPASALASDRSATKVILLQPERWLAGGDVERATSDFCGAVETFVQSGQENVLLIICPSSAPENREQSNLVAAERQITEALSGLSALTLVSGTSVQEHYQVTQISDPHGSRIAAIPFSADYFAALAATIARYVWHQLVPDKKVLVLDCDDTLWGGLCGELGPDGIVLEEPHLALQEHAKSCRQAGMLVCLVSKNNEADVLAVFEQNSGMVLSLDDVTAHQIGWGLKSDSVTQLSEILGLGLDSFIFVDDDPMQLAEVSRVHPEVVTLVPPQTNGKRFWSHFWPTDSSVRTEETLRRTESYREHAARESSRAQTLKSGATLANFIASLELRTEHRRLGSEDLSRVFELSQRTNQFNTNALRLSEPQLAAASKDPATICLTTRVSDRFGDYGLVGLIQGVVTAKTLHVTEFLLSCRALGRGVEHSMVAELARLAGERSVSIITFAFTDSGRNVPALEFLTKLVGVDNSTGSDFTVTCDQAVGCRFESEESRPAERELQTATPSVQTDPGNRNRTRNPDFLTHVAGSLATGEQILNAFIRTNTAASPSSASEASDIESLLTKAFCGHLGLNEVDREEGFFDLGGHSLQAVQILSEMSAAANVELDPTLLFTTNFSIAELAEEIEFQDTTGNQPVGSVLDQLSALTDS